MHGFFFISSQIYTHTHKVVTECVINTLSVSVYTYIHIYNQIWEPDLDLFVSKKREDFLCARERFSSSSSFFSFLL